MARASLACAAKAPTRPAPLHAEAWLVDGRKAPIAPQFALDWDWSACSEPRAALFEAACRMGAPGSGSLASAWAARVAELSHPALAEGFARATQGAFARVAGSDAILASFLEARELEAHALPGAAAKAQPRL